MTSNSNIRHADPADLDAIVRLDQLSFSDPWPRSGWHYELNYNPKARLWVAENVVATTNGEVIGLLATWLVLDELHIGTIAVHPDHRQRGIGATLLEVGLRESIAQGVTLSHLEVRKSNLLAQALYRRFGFEIVGERKRYYSNDHEDAILMSVYGLGEAYVGWLESGRQTPWIAKVQPSSHKFL